MRELPSHVTPDIWLRQFLGSAEARRGGIVKRKIRDVERLVGREVFAREVHRRGFQAVENGAHFVVFCNAGPIRNVSEQRAARALQSP